MPTSQKDPSRKKFLLWAAAVLSSATVLRFFSAPKKPVKSDTVKMLTQDGRLVEIDKSMLASGGKKISNEELKQWVKNKPANNKTITNEL